jgi:hypothetical protein
VSGWSCSSQAAIHGPKALIAAKKDSGPPGPRRQADARFALQGMHTLKKPKMRNRCVHSRQPESARHLAADANPSERADHFGIRISIGTDGMLKSSPHAAAPHSMFTFGPTPSDDCVRLTLGGDFHRRRLGHPGLERTQPSREAVGVPPFPSKRSRPPRVWIAAAHLIPLKRHDTRRRRDPGSGMCRGPFDRMASSEAMNDRSHLALVCGRKRRGSGSRRKSQGDDVDADRTSRNPSGNARHADRAAAGNTARQPKPGSAAADA